MNGNHNQQIQFHFCEVNLWVTFDLRSQIEGYIYFYTVMLQITISMQMGLIE